MILLSGGMTYKMLGFPVGFCVISITLEALLHIAAKKNNYYQAEFRSFPLIEKLIYYILFLIVGGFIS